MMNTMPTYSLFGVFQQAQMPNTPFASVHDDIGILEVNEQYQEHMKLIEPAKHLMAGTQTMKDHCRKYIPQEDGESDTGYANRVKRAILYKFFSKACSRIAGEIFKHEVTMLKIGGQSDFTPDQIQKLNDIDMSGNNLHVFLASCMQHAIPFGGVHVIVNEFSPSIIEVGEGRRKKKMYYNAVKERFEDYTTKAEADFGTRTFFSMVKPENVLPPIIYVRHKGKKIPALFRIYDEVLLPDPKNKYQFNKVRRIISFEHRLDINPAAKPEYSIYHIEEETNPKQTVANSKIVLKEGPVQLQSEYLPIFSFFTSEDKNGVPTTLALQDLIDLNLLHFQSTTDQRNILHYARMITYFGKHLKGEADSFSVVGDDLNSPMASDPVAENLRASIEAGQSRDSEIPLGCNILVHSSHDKGELKAVETTGAAINAGRQDLQDIEANISFFSNSMFSDKRNRVSATERVQNTQESYSDPQTWAVKFKDFATTICAELFKTDIELSMNVEISPDFNEEKATFLREAAGTILPIVTVIEEVKKRGLLHSTSHSAEDLFKMLVDERKMLSQISEKTEKPLDIKPRIEHNDD